MELEDLYQRVKRELSEERFFHSQAVSSQAKKIAPLFGADPHQAEIAGLVHDIAKEIPAERQLQYLKSRDILLSIELLDNPPVWHGITASVLLEEEWGITQEEIRSAVYYHTMGKSEMSPLEQTIFVADYTSMDRDYPDLPRIRQLLEKQPLAAISEGLRFGLESALKHHRLLIPETVAAYQYYLLKSREGKDSSR